MGSAIGVLSAPRGIRENQVKENQNRGALLLQARSIVVALAFALTSAGSALAGNLGAVVPLPVDLRAAADKYLPGVIGEPVAGFTLDPSLASLNPGTRTYQIVSGPDAGKTEQHAIVAIPRDSTGEDWRYTFGDRVLFLHATSGQSLAVVTEQDTRQGVMTKYSPGEPMLIAGMNPGDSRTMQVKVAVYDLNDPSNLEHSGSLDLTITYVGAYKVTVPAGTYDAAALLWNFKGKVGPATIDDTQARLVAADVGMVAAAEKRDVAAMLLYNDNSKVGKVLKQP